MWQPKLLPPQNTFCIQDVLILKSLLDATEGKYDSLKEIALVKRVAWEKGEKGE